MAHHTHILAKEIPLVMEKTSSYLTLSQVVYRQSRVSTADVVFTNAGLKFTIPYDVNGISAPSANPHPRESEITASTPAQSQPSDPDHGHMAPSLNQDVLDRTIDCLAGDSRTLLACSLVCRTWFSRSSYNLYRDVRIANKKQLQLLCATLQHNPSLRALTHSVTLRYTTSSTPDILRSHLFEIVPVSLLALLPNLQQWVIDGSLDPRKTVKALSYSVMTLEVLSKYSKPILELHIRGVTFKTSATLGQFVSAFRNLQTLRCERISFQEPPVSSAVKRCFSNAVMPRLSELEVSTSDDERMHRCLPAE